tara:strand:- start:534 stop:695 length:162 start_codon:yes stop_codon:yes gene_type:complete
MINKIFSIIFISSLSFSQLAEHGKNPTIELRSILENASRLQQKVWVEDFTGLN